MLNIMSSYGWYEKSLQQSDNYQPVKRNKSRGAYNCASTINTYNSKGLATPQGCPTLDCLKLIKTTDGHWQ